MGTGIVVDERGYIVTNYHVIQDVDLISVTIHGGSTYEGPPGFLRQETTTSRSYASQRKIHSPSCPWEPPQT